MEKKREEYWKRIFKSVLGGLILVLIIIIWDDWRYTIRLEGLGGVIMFYLIPQWVVISVTLFITPFILKFLFSSPDQSFLKRIIKSLLVGLILLIIIIFFMLSLDGWKFSFRNGIVGIITNLVPAWIYLSLLVFICSLINIYFHKANKKQGEGISPTADLTRFKDLKPTLGVEILDQAKKIEGKVEYDIAFKALTGANISEWYAKRMLEHRGKYIAVAKIRQMLRDPEEALPGGRLLSETLVMECPRCESHNIEVIGENRKNFSIVKAAAGRALAGRTGTLAGFVGSSNGYDSYCKDCRHRFRITNK